MRLKVMSVVVLLLAVGMASAQKVKWVQPQKDGVGVYKNQLRQVYEEPMATVGTADRLEVIDQGKDAYKVRFGGKEGWVEKRMVVTAAKGSKTFMFEDAEVIGYLDNPTPVYIIDADDKDKDPIKLDRSFADALRENVDKETVERQVK